MKHRGAFEISFAWLFAIIIGAMILVAAIFLSVKIIGLGETQASAQTGKEIGILLNPLETGFESARSASFSLPIETRIYGSCDEYGNFGRQLIGISQKSFNKWTETDLKVQFLNKYIFNKEYVEGKNFYVFSKPFEFPFKVADLIYLTSADEKYCFIGAPDTIKRELENLNQGNFIIENCTSTSINVCFGSETGCKIIVDYAGKSVQTASGKVYFEGDALMYAAIFSDKDIYECQLKRLMKRVNELATLYKDKIILTSREGCDSNLDSDLSALKSITTRIESSANLGVSLNALIDGMKEKNKYSTECKLF